MIGIRYVFMVSPVPISAALRAWLVARAFRDTRLRRSLVEQQLPARIRRHHETLLVASVARGDVLADDPDDFAPQVEHGPARVAGVDRRIGLEKLGERHGAIGGVGCPASA